MVLTDARGGIKMSVDQVAMHAQAVIDVSRIIPRQNGAPSRPEVTVFKAFVEASQRDETRPTLQVGGVDRDASGFRRFSR